MTQPNPDQAAAEKAAAEKAAAEKAAAEKAKAAVKVGDVVSYTRTDPLTGALEQLIGVVVRVAEKGIAHLIRPLAHYAHEVDPADVTATSSDVG